MKIIKDNKTFLYYSNSDIKHIAMRVIKRKMTEKELRLLKAKTITEIHNLIIKIDSSGCENKGGNK